MKQISTSSVVTPDFRLLFESAPALCLVLDPDFHIVAASNSYLSATMTQRDQILGRDIFEVFPDNPGDSAATGVANLKTSLQRVVRDKVPDAMAVQKYDIARPATAGGGFEERYWSPINSPVSSGDRLLFIIHMVEDVTELVHLKRLGSEHEKMFEELQSHVGRTEAEVVHRARQVQDTNARLARANEELRQSEELLRMVVDGAKGYAIFVLDTQGRIKTWSAAAQRIKGYSAQEIIGQHISRFYLPQDVQRGKPQAALREALEKGSYEDEGWRVRKDGSRFWANVAISCIRDSRGTHIGFSKITRDLTERKRVEEERDQFFNLSLDMLCIADFNGYFKRVNPAFTRVLGYTPEEMMARPWAEFLHPGDTDRTSAEYGRNALGKESVEFENRYRCKDGTYKWLSWVALPIVEQKRIYAAARDVTERRQADERIRSLNQELTRHTAELEAASSELESFSYSVSHDLRAPLRSLDGFSQALLEDYADKLDNEGKDHLRRIRASSQRMGQLIDDLLNLSRMTRKEMHRERVDLSEMARGIIQELRAQEPQRGVCVDIAPGLVAEADPHLIRVVLTNLLGNAWKFTAKRPDARIEFASSSQEGKTEYVVRDNGAGFDMAYVDKLFGAFQRLHSASEFPGTGIGLATVQRIVHRHGGRAWAQGAVDGGASFHFTI